MYLTPPLGSEQRRTVESRNLHKMSLFVPRECRGILTPRKKFHHSPEISSL